MFLMFVTTSLFSHENYELNLYEKVLPAIFKKNHLKVYVDEDAKELMRYSSVFTIVSKCSEASLLIGAKFNDISTICLHKPLFSTSYKSFKNNHNSFGAFYWRKSRPQIKFKNKVLKRYNLKLPKSLIRFAKWQKSLIY